MPDAPQEPKPARSEAFPWHGRVAAVTGASRGIGAAIATGALGAGARVFGLSRSGTGPEGVEPIACDVTDWAAVARAFAAIDAACGRLGVLVNAAGQSLPAALGEGDGDPQRELHRFRTTLEVDLTAAFSCTLAAAPLLARTGGGAIVNVTSINSGLGFPANPGYVAAKAGLAGLTRALAVDLAGAGIRVNAVAPGYVRTAMTEASFSDPVLSEQRRRHTLLGRWGMPRDVVGAVLFLGSDAAAYITGHELIVDGGWSINGLKR